MWKLDINTGYNLVIRVYEFKLPSQMAGLTTINFIISEHISDSGETLQKQANNRIVPLGFF